MVLKEPKDFSDKKRMGADSPFGSSPGGKMIDLNKNIHPPGQEKAQAPKKLQTLPDGPG
jgi:hypothetical protein